MALYLLLNSVSIPTDAFDDKEETMPVKHHSRYVPGMYAKKRTSFVGRATHLILPREKVMAVRFISSRDHRIKRVADILNVSVKEAAKKLDQEDKLQRDFFRKNFNKKDANPYEFDMVINRDFIRDAQDAAELVYQAYIRKFNVNPTS